MRRGGWGGSRGARAGEGVTGPAMADNEKLDNQRLKNFKNKGRDLEVNSGAPEGWGLWASGRSTPGLGVWGVGAGAAAGPRGNGAGGRPVRDACANAPGSLCRAWSASAGERGAGVPPARPRPAPRSRPGSGARGWAARRGGRVRRVRRRRVCAALPGPGCGPHPGSGGDSGSRSPTDVGRRGQEGGGRWRGGLACGDRVSLGTSSVRPESSPLKGIFFGLPDSRFTPASPQYSKLQESTSPLKKNTPGVRGHPGDANSAFQRPVFYYGYS